MPTEPQQSNGIPQASAMLEVFNKHGLPGLVIAVQFLLIGCLVYVVVTALQSNTKAMTEFTGAVREMKDTIKDQR